MEVREFETIEDLFDFVENELLGGQDGQSNKQRNELTKVFLNRMLGVAEEIDIDPIDYMLACLKGAAGMGARVVKPGHEKQVRETMHVAVDQYFDQAITFFRQRNSGINYDEARGRKDYVGKEPVDTIAERASAQRTRRVSGD